MEMKKLRGAELKGVQQYEVAASLDPDTAHPVLIRSEGGKQVNHGDVVKKLPAIPKSVIHVQPDLKTGVKKCKCKIEYLLLLINVNNDYKQYFIVTHNNNHGIIIINYSQY